MNADDIPSAGGLVTWALGVSAVPDALDSTIPFRPVMKILEPLYFTSGSGVLTILAEERGHRTAGRSCTNNEVVDFERAVHVCKELD